MRHSAEPNKIVPYQMHEYNVCTRLLHLKQDSDVKIFYLWQKETVTFGIYFAVLCKFTTRL